MGKNQKKKADKGYIIAISLCVAAALLVVGAIVLPEPITASVELSSAKNFIETSDTVKVVINSTAQSGGILADAEQILDSERGDELLSRLLNILKNVKYSKTYKANTGIWKTKIVIYNATDELRVYVDGDGVYLERNGRLIKYKIPEKNRGEYDLLYEEINEILK